MMMENSDDQIAFVHTVHNDWKQMILEILCTL